MYLDFDNPNQLADALTETPHSNTRYLLLLADRHRAQLDEIVETLNDRGIDFYGAIFPGLIVDREQKQSGAIIKRQSSGPAPVVIQLDQCDAASVHNSLPSLPEQLEAKPSLYIFIDCLAPRVSCFLDTLFNHYANKLTYFGGAAGNSRLEPGATVFTNEGAFSNAAVVSIDQHTSQVNVRHGWERVEGPFIATSTAGNIIRELNWESAQDVYKRSLPEELRGTPADEFYNKITPTYPFSIKKEGSEDIVRDPVGFTEEGGIVCISDVPENSVIYLVHGEQSRLIDAASQAVSELVDDHSKLPDSCLVCDCYSRAIMFGDQFTQELDSIADRLQSASAGLRAEGALVLGEIASNGEQSLELYNKTFVVSLADEPA